MSCMVVYCSKHRQFLPISHLINFQHRIHITCITCHSCLPFNLCMHGQWCCFSVQDHKSKPVGKIAKKLWALIYC